jgi:hypothetical protein
MTETMTLESINKDMRDCLSTKGVGYTYSRLAQWILGIDAAIKARDARVAAVVMPDWRLSGYKHRIRNLITMVATNGSGAGAARHDVEEIFAELAAPQPPAQPEFDEDQAADHAREYFTRQFKDHLNPATACLVWNFALALGNKLADAEKKYGYTDGWRSTDWMDECRAKLLEHVAKGDPRDVAAYCAFLWHHGERTAAQPEPASADAEDMDHRSPEHLTGYALLRLLDECRKVPSYEGDESFNDAIAYVDRVIGQAARAAKGGEE